MSFCRYVALYYRLLSEGSVRHQDHVGQLLFLHSAESSLNLVDDRSVSRRHAQLHFSREASRWEIVDLNSRFGTFVNGAKLSADAGTALKPGDLIKFGGLSSEFE